MISSGKAKAKFREMIAVQGGDPRVVDQSDLLPRADHTVDICSPCCGYVAGIMCEQIGTASLLLGGGRLRKEDQVDPAVGVVVHKKLGDEVRAGDALCTVHYNAAERLEIATSLILQSYSIEPQPPESDRKIVHQVIGDSKP